MTTDDDMARARDPQNTGSSASSSARSNTEWPIEQLANTVYDNNGGGISMNATIGIKSE